MRDLTLKPLGSNAHFLNYLDQILHVLLKRNVNNTPLPVFHYLHAVEPKRI